MRRRVATLAIVLAAVLAQVAAGLTSAAFQEAGESTGVEVSALESPTDLEVLRFAFDPGGSIDQQDIPEPMLVQPKGGAFILYIPEAAGGKIVFRGREAPFAVDSTDCTLPLADGQQQVCTFDDQPSSTTLQCVEIGPRGSDPVRQCDVDDTVGIYLPPGTTFVSLGNIKCMVCKLDANAGELEVAAAVPPGDSTWGRAVLGSAQATAVDDASASPQTEEPVDASPSAVLIDPCGGLIRRP